MKRIFHIVIISISTLLALQSFAINYEMNACNQVYIHKDQKLATVKWAKIICREKDRYVGWPSVCRLQNGDVIAVFSGDRDYHICPFGKVQMIRSTDDGETWGEPITIANGIIDDRDAGILQMPDGEIIVTYFTSIAYAVPFEFQRHPYFKRHHEKIPQEMIPDALGYFLIRSRDNGKTWSKPEKLENCDQSPHGPILLRDGSLLQMGRRTKKDANAMGRNIFDKTIITVSRSTDAGRTWKYLCEEIPTEKGENDKPSMFHEPHLVELSNGTLVGLVRYHGTEGENATPGNGYMRITFSKDGGKTWSPLTATKMLGLPPHLMELPDGRLMCAYNRRNVKPGFGQFACLSADGGKTWDVENEITLMGSSNDDLGYPASCLLQNGDIITVYYHKPDGEPRPVIMATKWNVKGTK